MGPASTPAPAVRATHREWSDSAPAIGSRGCALRLRSQDAIDDAAECLPHTWLRPRTCTP